VRRTPTARIRVEAIRIALALVSVAFRSWGSRALRAWALHRREARQTACLSDDLLPSTQHIQRHRRSRSKPPAPLQVFSRKASCLPCSEFTKAVETSNEGSTDHHLRAGLAVVPAGRTSNCLPAQPSMVPSKPWVSARHLVVSVVRSIVSSIAHELSLHGTINSCCVRSHGNGRHQECEHTTRHNFS
jgi:hypothetical protein